MTRILVVSTTAENRAVCISTIAKSGDLYSIAYMDSRRGSGIWYSASACPEPLTVAAIKEMPWASMMDWGNTEW